MWDVACTIHNPATTPVRMQFGIIASGNVMNYSDVYATVNGNQYMISGAYSPQTDLNAGDNNFVVNLDNLAWNTVTLNNFDQTQDVMFTCKATPSNTY